MSEYESDYEQGYEDGGRSVEADWSCALDEACDLPEDVPPTPWDVARYIAKLQKGMS